MELLTAFHLFGFVSVLGVGALFWYERIVRKGDRKRTTYLTLSLVSLMIVGVFQTVTWVFRDTLPLIWPQVFVVSGMFYFLALYWLEYAIHVKRIHESFLVADFRKEVRGLWIWSGVAMAFTVLIVAAAASWQWDHRSFPLSLLLTEEATENPVLAYSDQMRLLSIIFSISLLGAAYLTARKVFNLKEGTIRQRAYPFYLFMAVLLVLTMLIVLAPRVSAVEKAPTLPLLWFSLINLVYVIRLAEEFFFWSQYNLRSDRAKIEQRQYTQNLLIRRVIGSAEEDDQVIIRELIEGALDKSRSRLVVQEYQMTGLTAYRAVGNVLRVEDVSHLVGYCTPLTDSKATKSLDKQKLGDLILRTTYDIAEIRETMLENLKDFGKRLVKEAMTTKEIVVTSDLPEGLKGLQRLAVIVPIFDSSNFMGFLTVFKDSFDQLYPAEREVLAELSESLATVYALMAGKEIQRERNRLQGEMNTAREIQTSILPKKIQMPGFEIGTFMETATEVGGDVFDFIPTPFGTYFGIGDVSGHGLPAGMMAVISVAALHGALDASKVLGKPLPLDQVYDTVNRVLCTLNRDRIGSDKFMTQNYFVANGGKIDHVGTHLPAAVWRAKAQHVEELKGLTDRTGFLGLSEFVVSDQSLGSFAMESGDMLVLYSDGVSEAKNGNGTMFGLEGIKHALVEHSAASPDEFVAALLEDLRRHAATGDLKKHAGRFTDDVTLVVLKKL